MRVPIIWLKDFVNLKISTKNLADKLAMSGLEATSLENGNILEVDILPNRGDCNSIIGVAHEVAAITNSKIKVKKLKLKESAKKASSVLKVEIKDLKLCPRYMARVIENVKIKESPDWLKQKLIAAGSRPINNIVDITNYLLIELGQPMHAFDYDKIQGQKIIVRRAEQKETIKTLDGEERKLNEDVLVIADTNRAVAIAGIMGGANSEVSYSTKTVVLESAYFNPINISKSSKFLKHRTDASARFEKSVDWEMVSYALDAAASMVAELGEGTILAKQIDIKSKIMSQKPIVLRISKLNQILGMSISIDIAAKILQRLGFKLLQKDSKSIKVLTPSWRYADVEREIDLIEEVARIYGYHHVPITNPRIRRSEVIKTRSSIISGLKDMLVGAGLYEIQTYSFVDPKDALFESIKVMNPMTISESVMRTSMLPSLLKVVSHNNRHQVDEVNIFEVGKVFNRSGAEKLILAGALRHDKVDFYEVKSIIDAIVLEYLDGYNVTELNDPWYNPSKSAQISSIAKFGQLHPEMAKKYEIQKDIYVFEIDLGTLLSVKKMIKHEDLPKYPKVERDVAMFVPDGITYDQILLVIKQAAGPMLEEVKLFDVYKNSQAYRLSFRDKNATLTDAIVNERFINVIKQLEEQLKVQIRK